MPVVIQNQTQNIPLSSRSTVDLIASIWIGYFLLYWYFLLAYNYLKNVVLLERYYRYRIWVSSKMLHFAFDLFAYRFGWLFFAFQFSCGWNFHTLINNRALPKNWFHISYLFIASSLLHHGEPIKVLKALLYFRLFELIRLTKILYLQNSFFKDIALRIKKCVSGLNFTH